MLDIVKKIIKTQEDLVENYKYKALPPLFSMDVRNLYKEGIPDHFSIDGDIVLLYSNNGTLISNGYNRIVIGDYGAYIEISKEQIIRENLKIKEGQEYREQPNYEKNVKYSWLTTNDTSNCKIYLQKREVDYADYLPEYYYISPYEVILDDT